MSMEESERIINQAEEILEDEKDYFVSIPLGSAYYIGRALGLAINLSGEDMWTITPGSRPVYNPKYRALAIIETVVPDELVRIGREDYHGDLSQQVSLEIAGRDVKLIGQIILEIPSGAQMKDVPPPPDHPFARPELDALRNQALTGFLDLQRGFVGSGGKADQELAARIEAELS